MKTILLITFILHSIISYLPSGEFTLVDDLKDNEVRKLTENEYIHIFEDFNFESLDRKIFLKKTKTELSRILHDFSTKLQIILDNEKNNDKNVGPKIIELLGEDFKNIKAEKKDLEVDIKAFIEKQIDMFFLYKCQNKFFNESDKFPHCKNLSKLIKKNMMFENFFDFGFKNMIMDILNENFIDDEFNYLLKTKIENIRITWKLFLNLCDFSVKQFIGMTKRKITKKYGNGLNVMVTIERNQYDLDIK